MYKRQVEDHLGVDLHVQEVHDDGIYRLNECLLSARSQCATVEVRESDSLEEEVFEEWIFSDGEDEDQYEFDTASGTVSECSAVNEVEAETTVLAPLTWVDEAQGSARQCGSGIAISTQVMPKYISNMPGRQASDLLPVCDCLLYTSPSPRD